MIIGLMREILPGYEEEQAESNGLVDPNCFEVKIIIFLIPLRVICAHRLHCSDTDGGDGARHVDLCYEQ